MEWNVSVGIAELWRQQAIDGFSGKKAEIPPLDLATIGAQFPIKSKRAYLNNASIGPMSEPVIAAVDAFLHDVRDHGRNNYPTWCTYADQDIKGRIAKLIGATAAEIAFVKNTTEGLVIVANGLDWREGDNVILPSIEYPSNVYCWMRLKKKGVSIKWVKPVNGRVTIESLAEAVDSRTRLISVSAVQFSNGFRQNLAQLSELCVKRGVLLNLDAIQWIGSLHLDLTKYHVDFLSTGGHKWLLAPIGTGFFYCNRKSMNSLEPPNVGYHTVNKGEAHMDYDLTYREDAGRFEEALVNFPGIWGLDAAIKILLGLGTKNIENHILGLTGYAAEGLQKKGWQIVSPMEQGDRSGLLSFHAPKADLTALEMQLREAGVDLAIRDGRLRISPSYYNDRHDIDRAIRALPSQ